MSAQVFDEVINSQTNSNSYFNRFEKLFFKKLKEVWDEYNDPDYPHPGYLLSERVVECFTEAKNQVIEIKKRRKYALDN